MENASKALLMAAGMLIAVMVASMIALMFSTMSQYTKEYDDRKQTEELQAFNAQFEKYVDEGATAQDIVTIINLAKSYNEKNGYKESDTNYYINVDVTSTTIEETSDRLEINSFLKENSTYNDAGIEKMQMYTMNINKSEVTGKVKSVTFTKI